MTDLLDAPAAHAIALERPGGVSTRPMAPAPARWALAALVAGAAAIHLAMAPSHLGESAIEGAGFLAAAWAQVALAVAVVARGAARWPLRGAVVVSGALIAAWAISRTAGLPFGAHRGHAESVGFVDGAAVGLEIAAVVVAVALLARATGVVARSTGVAIAGVLGAIVLSTAAIASPSARDHASHGHGDHMSAGGAAAGDAAAAAGHDHGTEEDDLGFSALSNGHQHEHGSDEPLTSAEMVTLAKQLAALTPLMEAYPTIADAEAGGLRRAGPFSPGLGVHYRGALSWNPDGLAELGGLAAPMLIYDGVEADASLAGFMFLAYGTAGEPEGFAGPNDHWHYHEHVCIVQGPDGAIETPFGADLPGLTAEMCTDVGGAFIEYTGYMVHVWNVPGYESPDGMFTELNPKLTCPDGTYHTIPIEELGTRTSTCRNP